MYAIECNRNQWNHKISKVLERVNTNLQSLTQMTSYCAMVYKSITTVTWTFESFLHQ